MNKYKKARLYDWLMLAGWLAWLVSYWLAWHEHIYWGWVIILFLVALFLTLLARIE